MMQLTLATKLKMGFYVIKNMVTKPTFNKYNPDDVTGFYVDPNPLHDEMRRNHKIFFSPRTASWMCSLDRDETFAMGKSDKFSVNFNDWMFAPKPKPESERDELEKILCSLLMSLPADDHRRIRRLVQPAFLPKNIVKMQGAIESIVDEAMKNAKGDFNLVDITNEVPLKIVAELVGVPLSFQREFKGLADSIIATYTPTEAPAPALAFEGIKIVRRVIEDRRENPTDDFISVLIQTADEDGDKLTIDEVMAFVASLLTAGPDTTAHYMNFAIYTILKNKEVIAELRENPDLIEFAIAEATRLNYFTHSGGVRFATVDTEIAGQQIRKGEMVKFNVNTANLDPAVFPDPFKYDIHRENLKDAWIFGTGSHFCVGAAFAKSIGVAFVKAFINKCPNAEIIEVPIYEKDFISRKMVNLRVRANN